MPASKQKDPIRALRAIADRRGVGNPWDLARLPSLPYLPDHPAFRALQRAANEWNAFVKTDAGESVFLDYFTYHQISDTARPYVEELRRALGKARQEARARLKHLAAPPTQVPRGGRFKLAQALAPQLLTIPGIRGVYVFGSVARGQDRDTSDLDLFLWRTNTRLHYFREMLLMGVPDATWAHDPEWFRWQGQLCQFVLSGRTPARADGFDDAQALLVPSAADAFAAHARHPAVWAQEDVWVQPTTWREVGGEWAEARGIGETAWHDRLIPFTWHLRSCGDDEHDLQVTAKPRELAEHLGSVMADWPASWIATACARADRLRDVHNELEEAGPSRGPKTSGST